MSDLATNLNRLAGTTGRDAVGAANVWAGTTGRDLAGALNVKAGTTGLDAAAAARQIVTTALGSCPLVDLVAALRLI